MTDSNHRPEPDYLEDAIGALRAAPVPAGPSAELAAATVAAVQSRFAGPVPVEPARSRVSRRTVMRYLGYGSAATAAAALVAVWLVGGKAVAFDDALARVEKAEAVRYQVRVLEDGNPKQTQSVVVHGNKVRVEGTDFPLAFVIDHDAKGAIILDSHTKTYQTMDISVSGVGLPDMFSINLRSQVLNLKKQKAEAAGTEKVDGATLDKFTVAGGTALGQRGADWSFWIDRKSQYPVKVVSEQTITMKGAKLDGTPIARELVLTRVFEKFDWNPTVEKDLFSLDPPEGYTEREIFKTIPPITPYKKK